MNSPYNNIQLQQIQQQLHQHFMGGANNNAMMGMMMLPTLPMHLTQEISEPIVVEESDDEDDEEQRTLFVANLDERVTEELLYEIFLQAGPIERAKIPKDNVGRQRTFGFITYTKRCSAPYAMHLLKGLALYRKSLTIKYKGKNMAPPLKSESVLGVGGGNNGNNRQSYDNSSLRSGNFSSYKDSNRMMDNTSPSGSSRQERISKHASNQMRQHSNSGPYQQRRDSPNSYDKWNNNHNNNNNNHHNNNGRNNNHNNNNNKNGNRYSDHRSGKYRR